MSETLARLRAVDWTDKPEPTISSQLILPVLALLGYGEHTLHKVREQQTYTLRDPYFNKGTRRIRLDYQPRVYEEGLWVMEAKGTDARVTPKTLGQVRDYAIHPEVRAALMVTVDAKGFRVFDPWDEHWDEPLLVVGVNEVADRIDELRAVLATDRVAELVRLRHLNHLKRALSTSIEFGVLKDAEREFRELIEDARKSIGNRRREAMQRARQEADELHDRVLRSSGVWGVAQHNNTPWIGGYSEARDFAKAVLHQDERQRPTQILSVWPAIEAVYERRCPDGAYLRRPLWWLHIVALGGSILLRGESGCEPYATDMARQQIRDAILGFPDNPAEAASWRLQRELIPMLAKAAGAAPLRELSQQARAQLSPEDRIRYSFEPGWFLMQGVQTATVDFLAKIEPWEPKAIDHALAEVREAAEKIQTPSSEWFGPMGVA